MKAHVTAVMKGSCLPAKHASAIWPVTDVSRPRGTTAPTASLISPVQTQPHAPSPVADRATVSYLQGQSHSRCFKGFFLLLACPVLKNSSGVGTAVTLVPALLIPVRGCVYGSLKKKRERLLWVRTCGMFESRGVKENYSSNIRSSTCSL